MFPLIRPSATFSPRGEEGACRCRQPFPRPACGERVRVRGKGEDCATGTESPT